MASTVVAATAMTSTIVAATAMESSTTSSAGFAAAAAAEPMSAVTGHTASLEAAVASTESAITFSEASITSTEFMTATEVLESAPVVASVEFRMPVIKMIPGTGADEHTAREPLRTPEAIRCAREGIIRVEPVHTYWGSIVKAVIGTYLDADCNLGVRIDRRER
jgi:hypothetical protein